MCSEKKQVKFTIENDVLAAFKAGCESERVSMTAVIRQWMTVGSPPLVTTISVSTRPQRRKAVLNMIGTLNTILQAEADYRDNIPEQFEQRYEAADYACEKIEEAVSCLEDAF
jgi:hypothetical protein